jgi:hypothetical protein
MSIVKLRRVRMKRRHDQLEAGQCYNLPPLTANWLIGQGFAEDVQETKPAGPSEIKPIGPAEVKTKKKPFRTSPA